MAEGHPEIVATYTNSEGEEMTIERVTRGDFAGQLVLVIHDDYPSKVRAPMLLDEGTREWLLMQLQGAVAYERTAEGTTTTFVDAAK